LLSVARFDQETKLNKIMFVLRVLRLLRVVESTQALALVASSRIVVYTVSRWDRTQYLMFYSTAQYGAVRYGTVRYSTVPKCTVQYCNVKYGTVRCAAVRYGRSSYAYGTGHYARRAVHHTAPPAVATDMPFRQAYKCCESNDVTTCF
jgi:hypothetical protein